jgi:hypothetical protein
MYMSYIAGNSLIGIIYLQSIVEPRLNGSAIRNLRVFKQLCGSSAFSSVIFVTTFWSRVDEIIGSEREKTLVDREDLWGKMISMGSIVCRHDNGETSARDIMDRLIMARYPIVLNIQREMVNCGLSLQETVTGLEFDAILTEQNREGYARTANHGTQPREALSRFKPKGNKDKHR